MTGIYGHKWVTSYGPEVSDTWVRGCSDLNGDELARGLRSCLKRSQSFLRSGDEDWPPTLGEFHLLCRPQKPSYYEPYPGLPAPKISKDDALKHIADIRAKLKEINDLAVRASEGMVAREPGSDDEEG